MRSKWFVSILMMVFTACQGLSATPFPENFSGMVDVGDFELYMTCAGKGEPTIILENSHNYHGLGYSWDFHAPARFSKITRTCTYHKFEKEVGQITAARTIEDQAKDLHKLLKNTGVPGPYLLVGSGTGAWNILLFTKLYPKEVVGLVCIDCAPPGIWSTFFEKIEIEHIEILESDQAEINSFRKYLEDYTTNVEGLDLAASSNLAEEVNDLGDRPFVVLAVPPPDLESIDPASALIEGLWQSLDQKMCNLSSHCRFENVPGATEGTLILNPVVDGAVKEVYEAVK